MIRSMLIVILPVLFIVDVAFLLTWLTILYLDGFGIPKRITRRGVLIALAVIAIHAAAIGAYLSDPIGLEDLPLEKMGEASDISGPN